MTQNFHTPLVTNAPALYSTLNTISSDLDAGITDTLIGNNIFQQLRFSDTAEAVTIAAGVISITESLVVVDTEAAAAADDLVTINGGADGDFLLLTIANATHVVTVKHNTGNIYLATGFDIVLNDIRQVLPLLWDGTRWVEIGVFKGRQVAAFSAHSEGQGLSTIITTATYTKLAHEVEIEDVGGIFDTGNNRLAPTIPGRYLVHAGVQYSDLSDQSLYKIAFFKNGALEKEVMQRQSGTSNTGANFTYSLYLNGSTDYVEAYTYHLKGTDANITWDKERTYFSGLLLAQY